MPTTVKSYIVPNCQKLYAIMNLLRVIKIQGERELDLHGHSKEFFVWIFLVKNKSYYLSLALLKETCIQLSMLIDSKHNN